MRDTTSLWGRLWASAPCRMPGRRHGPATADALPPRPAAREHPDRGGARPVTEPRDDLPSIDEIAMGAFLHDVGKLLQRATGSTRDLAPIVQGLDHEILPQWQGRYSHHHVLFTAALFEVLEEAGVELPAGMRLEQAPRAAVYHHNPDPRRPWTTIVTAADRLSAGIDRKARDKAEETSDDARRRDAYRRTPLRSPFDRIAIDGRAPAARAELRPVEAGASALFPQSGVDRSLLPDDYGATAADFTKALTNLCRQPRQPADVFHEGVIALADPSGGRSLPRPSTSPTCRCSTTRSRWRPSPPAPTPTTASGASFRRARDPGPRPSQAQAAQGRPLGHPEHALPAGGAAGEGRQPHPARPLVPHGHDRRGRGAPGAAGSRAAAPRGPAARRWPVPDGAARDQRHRGADRRAPGAHRCLARDPLRGRACPSC